MKETSSFQVRPLYLQVRDALLERIKKGELRPGGILPSEIDLHRQLRVSLGTLRKALGVLEAERLIVREPGRGTFVRGHQVGESAHLFNPIRTADGSPLIGEAKSGKVKVGSASDEERTALRLQGSERVARFERVRSVRGRPFAYELVCVPDRRFPGFAQGAASPNELEETARRWGVLLARAEGRMRAAAAPPAAAAALSLRAGAPVLWMERIAIDTDDQPVELMTAYFDLRDEFCILEMR